MEILTLHYHVNVFYVIWAFKLLYSEYSLSLMQIPAESISSSKDSG